jgi:hypothetical protein
MANACIAINGVAILDTYPRSDNSHVKENADELRPVENMQKHLALHGGYRNDTGEERICPSLMI